MADAKGASRTETSVDEEKARMEKRLAERERRRRLQPLFEELLCMSDQGFIELMLSAAEEKAGIRYSDSEYSSAWGNLDLTVPLLGIWGDFKDDFKSRVEAGSSRYEKVTDVFSDLTVGG